MQDIFCCHLLRCIFLGIEVLSHGCQAFRFLPRQVGLLHTAHCTTAQLCVTAQPPPGPHCTGHLGALLPGVFTPLGKAVAGCHLAGSASLASVGPSQSASFLGTFRIEIKDSISLFWGVGATGFDYWEPPPARVPAYGGRYLYSREGCSPRRKVKCWLNLSAFSYFP